MPPSQLTLRGVRVVRIGTSPAPSGAVDVRVDAGRITALAPSLPDDGSLTVRAEGRWLIPGLWDHHVHMTQWASNFTRLDVSETSAAADVVRLVAAQDATMQDPLTTLVGFGFRSAGWPVQPTVRELDAAVPSRPVVLISGDAHNGWLNSTALSMLGLQARDTPIRENEWFDVFPLLARLPGVQNDPIEGYRHALHDAAAKGVVGITDMEFESTAATWARMVPRGLDTLRVRAATYQHDLERAIADRLHTGDALPGTAGMVRMGPLKIIADGSLGTMTALCCQPYAGQIDQTGTARFGVRNIEPAQLQEAMTRATSHGLEAAVHAIGDAAAGMVLDAFEATGARGSIEHAQLLRPEDIGRLAALGLRASIQPAHLYDDRDLSEQLWPGCAGRSFMARSMLDAGVRLALGSDAPVAPLDPWLAMAAAVHRSCDEREPWSPEQALLASEALAASTDGRATVASGDIADLVLLDGDLPGNDSDSASAAATLRSMRVHATFVGGRQVYGAS